MPNILLSENRTSGLSGKGRGGELKRDPFQAFTAAFRRSSAEESYTDTDA